MYRVISEPIKENLPYRFLWHDIDMSEITIETHVHVSRAARINGDRLVLQGSSATLNYYLAIKSSWNSNPKPLNV